MLFCSARFVRIPRSRAMPAEPLLTASGHPMEGPLLFTPQVFGDDRGFFYESWNERRFCADLIAAGIPSTDAEQLRFRQDNHSRSTRGVLRGLHFQLLPEPQGKLVRCSLGAIFDVAVDLRRGSSSYGAWVGAELSAENHQQLWVPVGFAHGFLTLVMWLRCSTKPVVSGTAPVSAPCVGMIHRSLLHGHSSKQV